MAVQKISVQVSGMHCNGCANTVEKVLKRIPGVVSARVDFSSQQALVEFDQAQCASGQILEAISKAGYEPAFLAAQFKQSLNGPILGNAQNRAPKNLGKNEIPEAGKEGYEPVVK